ncbi:unnamed protein product [Linum trigynum]|uniref:Uncharacterized protein n=1 Tax=Linum trigynum TaxID=586398 RepID=A0AAV2GPT7_9ROSI
MPKSSFELIKTLPNPNLKSHREHGSISAKAATLDSPTAYATILRFTMRTACLSKQEGASRVELRRSPILFFSHYACLLQDLCNDTCPPWYYDTCLLRELSKAPAQGKSRAE